MAFLGGCQDTVSSGRTGRLGAWAFRTAMYVGVSVDAADLPRLAVKTSGQNSRAVESEQNASYRDRLNLQHMARQQKKGGARWAHYWQCLSG